MIKTGNGYENLEVRPCEQVTITQTRNNIVLTK
ncbi:MAG: hypothetical protein JWQ66_2176 [Mucilaginibacter sp.]|nr:hypothetical protein [Mucilaginibacter sp.]